MKVTLDDLSINRQQRVWVVTDHEAGHVSKHFAKRKEAMAYRAALLAFYSGSGSTAAVEAARATALSPE
jgi:predicted Zn-dependent protease